MTVAITAAAAAFAAPGQVTAAVYEDPPLFASEVSPAFGQSIHQAIGPLFELISCTEPPLRRIARGLAERGQAQSLCILATNHHGEACCFP